VDALFPKIGSNLVHGSQKDGKGQPEEHNWQSIFWYDMLLGLIP
jgi:hypothetical protein